MIYEGEKTKKISSTFKQENANNNSKFQQKKNCRKKGKYEKSIIHGTLPLI
jgi:hypothetical protein